MLLHHIKPEQFSQLETMFGKPTDKGFEVPPWLRRLRETAAVPPQIEDFQVTVPQEPPRPE